MTEFANKRPTLWMNWSVVGDDGCAKRALAFTTTKTKSSLPHELDQRPANSIAVGDRIRLELRSDMSGYLTIFDFMTSGRFAKLFPCPQLATFDNRIEAGKTYKAPGELLPIPDFRVSGPTTAESGRKERLLVVVTRHSIDLSESAVLNTGTAFATRGGFGAVEEAVSSLLNLPEDEWTYGLLETEIV